MGSSRAAEGTPSEAACPVLGTNGDADSIVPRFRRSATSASFQNHVYVHFRLGGMGAPAPDQHARSGSQRGSTAHRTGESGRDSAI